VALELSRSVTEREVLLRLGGELGIDEARGVYRALRSSAREPGRSVRIDLSGVRSLDSVSAAALREGITLLEERGKSVALSSLNERSSYALDIVELRAAGADEPHDATLATSDATRSERAHAPHEPARPRQRRLPALVALAELMVDTWAAWLRMPLGREKVRLRAIAEQAVRLGVDALPVVALLSFLTGLILAFQAVFQLRRFGAETLVAEIVALGMAREFGALMTAIILSGRSGSAIAAELGTMAIRDEIDALRAMGISPVSFLVVPRVLALGVLQPVLTIWATAVGIGGGLLTTGVVGLPTPSIYARMQESLKFNDFALGVGKSVLFAGIIAFTGCHLGLRTHGGARSVGVSTTRCVVTSILLIVVVDSIITTLWTNAGYGRH
jgi:phospholipid/cholesterol/gamma-HCH transport system permease protein